MDYSGVFDPPSAPPPPYEESVRQFEDSNSVVIFSVSTDFAHKVVRADRESIFNSEFARFLSNGTFKCTNGQYEVHCKTIESFVLYLRFLESKYDKFESFSEAQDVLELCIQFPNIELLKRAVSYLDFHVDHGAISLFRLLRTCNNNVSLPSSPARSGCSCKKNKTHNLTTSEHYIAALQENCLQYIDKHAEEVFERDEKELLELRFEELSVIVNRATLELSSELILIDLLAKWSWRQCEKRRLEVCDENRRRVLGALCYTPRYLAMPSKQFQQVFERVHLLDDSEESLVQNVYKGKKGSNLTSEQVQMILNFKKHRPYKKKARPVHLSDRSHPSSRRRGGTDYYATKKCSLGDCIYYTLCICFN